MHNSQNYSLKDEQENTKLQIMHRGIAGGWTMDTNECFSPEILVVSLFSVATWSRKMNLL